MPVLTERELNIMRGKISGSTPEKHAALLKLDILQKTLINQAHVDKINALIPQAQIIVASCLNNPSSAVMCEDRIYHQAMNILTREAGLRG